MAHKYIIKRILSICYAVVLIACAVVLTVNLYNNLAGGKAIAPYSWLLMLLIVLTLFMGIGAVVAMKFECGLYEDDDTNGYMLFAIIGFVLCLAGGICTVLVSEWFWIMTGIGAVEVLVFLAIGCAQESGVFTKYAYVVAATVAAMLCPLCITCNTYDIFTHFSGSGYIQGGGYYSYCGNEKVWRLSKAKELGLCGVATHDAEWLNIVSEVNSKPVTSIAKCSFRKNGNLRGVDIPTSIVLMQKNAFKNSKKLESAAYLGTVSEWCSITFENEYANPMYYADNFYTIDGLLTNAVLDGGLEKISSYSFYNCETLTEIFIPKSVNEIGTKTFYGCNSLCNIVFEGTVNEWRNVAKGENWIGDVIVTTVTCSNGSVTV